MHVVVEVMYMNIRGDCKGIPKKGWLSSVEIDFVLEIFHK